MPEGADSEKIPIPLEEVGKVDADALPLVGDDDRATLLSRAAVIAHLTEEGSLVLLTTEAAELLDALNADEAQRVGGGGRSGE